MQLLKRIRHLFQPRALVLMYHRIADIGIDPWQLAVSAENFEQHLQVLQETGEVVSLKQMVSSLQHKSVKDDSICVTFDDGYGDNYLVAKPLLEKYKCPAAFFIPTCYMGGRQQFWWDELENILLSYPNLPVKLTLLIRDTILEYDLGNDSILTKDQIKQHQLWSWPAKAPTRRCELYLAIWEQIRPLSHAELQSVINEIKAWASFTEPGDIDGLPMTDQQLKELAQHSLIDLGLHTDTHPALSYHNRQQQFHEISHNKQILENICERTIDTIAYPYGNYNDTTLEVVTELQLKAAFTTAEKIVSNVTHPLQIGRFQVRNWNGNDFSKHLATWKNAPKFL